MAEESNGQGESRLDRLERLMELLIDDHLRFTDEHKKLLTAQVLLTEAQKELATAQQRTDLKLAELAEAQKHTDERMDALIAVVDGFIRNPPQRPQ